MPRQLRIAPPWLFLLVACGGGTSPYELPPEEASRYPTVFIAEVVADPPGDDLESGAGEHVVLRTNWDARTDVGGWTVADADGNRLPLGIGRQIDPGTALRVHTSCGEDTEHAVFTCLDTEVLDDEGDVVTLHDSAGTEVARFPYGTERE